MSEDERPPRTADLSPIGPPPSDWAELLSCGELELEGRMPWSSNATFLVSLSLEGSRGRGIYKPARGERPLRDFPGGLYRREVAAYELGRACGLDVVPVTVVRHDGPFGVGSLQRFVDADFSEHYFSLLDDDANWDALMTIAGFDLLANNADRKGGHLLIDEERRIWGIDNGLCFSSHPKLRTVIWDFAGDPLPEAVLTACEQLLEGLPDAFYHLLSPPECAAIALRAEALLADPRFPAPRDDYRSYPWPLV